MAFSTSGNGSTNPQINVTPLIDVLLVLIIVFMVVVSMSQEKGLVADVPQQTQNSDETAHTNQTIVIQIVWKADNQPPALKINQQDVAWDELPEHLQKIFLQRSDRVAFVKGDDDVDFQYVADVIDIARNSGVDRVGLIGKQQ